MINKIKTKFFTHSNMFKSNLIRDTKTLNLSIANIYNSVYLSWKVKFCFTFTPFNEETKSPSL